MNLFSKHKKFLLSAIKVFIIVLTTYYFIGKIYIVPTGSLIPTIQPIELIFASHLSYGIRIPLSSKRIALSSNNATPKRGDIIIFKFPLNQKQTYIKRIIGVPADHIEYKDKHLKINGTPITQTIIRHSNSTSIFSECLFKKKYNIQIKDTKNINKEDDFSIDVPNDCYFVMGDNRDESFDSRSWGFVTKTQIIGRAKFIVFSFNKNKYIIRLLRIGNLL